MPLDALCLSALKDEIERETCGSRIEKIQQPSRDAIVLQLSGGRRL